MVIKAYEVCAKWCISFPKDNFRSEELRQEKFNKWLSDTKSNYKIHKIVIVDDNGVETLIKGSEQIG